MIKLYEMKNYLTIYIRKSDLNCVIFYDFKIHDRVVWIFDNYVKLYNFYPTYESFLDMIKYITFEKNGSMNMNIISDLTNKYKSLVRLNKIEKIKKNKDEYQFYLHLKQKYEKDNQL